MDFTGDPDDPRRPLGVEAPVRTSRRASVAKVAGGLALAAALIAGVAAARRDVGGGMPFAVATIEDAPKPVAPPHIEAPVAPPPVVAQVGGAGVITFNDDSGASRVKVMQGGDGPASAGVFINVAEQLGLKPPPAPDKRLVEATRHGAIPKIGVDGARAMDVYARSRNVRSRLGPNAPRAVLIVTGLGLDPAMTASAIEKLPGAVTLAFAPYGADVAGDARKAREAGHELLLQAPMEPFDFPRIDPGPHTLKTNSGAAENAEDLHWLMSRFAGYVGVAGYMGGKFTSEATALEPVLQEISARGLIVVDDASSARSRVGELSAAAHRPVVVADITADAVAAPTSLDLALTKLEAAAREKGLAVGAVVATPATFGRLLAWANGLEGHGVALTPLTQALGASASPSARAGK